jgi:hypothetical protein
MSKTTLRLAPALAAALISAAGSIAQAQPYPIADRVADRVIAKYQSSSCEQLAAARAAPPSAMEQQALQTLKQDPSMRTYFINKVAAAIANKLFDCGMIP